ncbi:MAG: hypothetical protein IJU23_10075 [Proteobacteria bacterium]|nr:hypothetical protein [Pseudomonadota bacterium]
MIKKILFLCLLALCLTTSCSKSKKDDASTTKTKTVDLGETENDNSADTADKGKAKKKTKPVDVDENEKGKKGSGSDEDREIARKNDEASKNPDGSSKRGKPAAELEAEEAAKNAQESDAEQAETADNAENAGSDNGYDFDAEEAPKRPARPPRPPKPKAALEMDKFINIREFREQTGFSGALSESYLYGQDKNPGYTSARLATDDSSQLGFSIQVWRSGNELAASKRFDDLFAQSFGGQKIKNVANDAFISNHHKLIELGFYDKGKKGVVLLSCTEKICSRDQMISIASVIQRRL